MATKDSSTADLEQLIGKSITIPPQPKILVDLHQLAHEESPKLNKIAQLVSKDVGLSAMVFKVINSPLYGLTKEVDSVSQAIAVIGLDPLFSIIKGIALRRGVGGNTPAYDRFWERSNDLALLCSIIAAKQRQVCRIAPDQAYMLGLFGECGVAILMQRFPDYCKALNDKQFRGWPDLEKEDRAFKTSHAVVGYLLAKNWRLPESICQAIRYAHDIAPHQDHETVILVAILQMAMHIARLVAGSRDDDWLHFQAIVTQELGISLDGLKEFEEEIIDLFHERANR